MSESLTDGLHPLDSNLYAPFHQNPADLSDHRFGVSSGGTITCQCPCHGLFLSFLFASTLGKAEPCRSFLVMTFAIPASPATAALFFLVDNDPTLIRTDIQPLDAGHIQLFPRQAEQTDVVGKNTLGVRLDDGNLGGMNKNISLALIGLSNGAGQLRGSCGGELSVQIDVQIAIAIGSEDVCFSCHTFDSFVIAYFFCFSDDIRFREYSG
jgi:hypothetical protein